MREHRNLATDLFFYLALWAVAVFVELYVYSTDIRSAVILEPMAISVPALYLFVIGVVGITIFDIKEKSSDIEKWGLILFFCGVTFNVLNWIPEFGELYIMALIESPAYVIGTTAMLLGMILLNFIAIPKVIIFIDSLIGHIKPKTRESKQEVVGEC